MKDALTTGEIAKLCGVNFRTVIRWIEKGYIEAYKLPGRGDNRVTRENVVKFMRNNNMPVPDELLPPQPEADAVDAGNGGAKEQGDGATGARRLLIVEDEELMARSIERSAKRAGYDVAWAKNGIEAGIRLETHRPHLITLDLQMPGMSGFELLEVIRANPAYAHIRILVVSAAGKVRETELLALGAHAVLDKPFQNDALLACLDTLLNPS